MPALFLWLLSALSIAAELPEEPQRSWAHGPGVDTRAGPAVEAPSHADLGIAPSVDLALYSLSQEYRRLGREQLAPIPISFVVLSLGLLPRSWGILPALIGTGAALPVVTVAPVWTSTATWLEVRAVRSRPLPPGPSPQTALAAGVTTFAAGAGTLLYLRDFGSMSGRGLYPAELVVGAAVALGPARATTVYRRRWYEQQDAPRPSRSITHDRTRDLPKLDRAQAAALHDVAEHERLVQVSLAASAASLGLSGVHALRGVCYRRARLDSDWGPPSAAKYWGARAAPWTVLATLAIGQTTRLMAPHAGWLRVSVLSRTVGILTVTTALWAVFEDDDARAWTAQAVSTAGLITHEVLLLRLARTTAVLPGRRQGAIFGAAELQLAPNAVLVRW